MKSQVQAEMFEGRVPGKKAKPSAALEPEGWTTPLYISLIFLPLLSKKYSDKPVA